MSGEIVAIIKMGVALAGQILTGVLSLRSEIAGLRAECGFRRMPSTLE